MSNQQPQVVGRSECDRHVSTGVEEGEARGAGHGISGDDALKALLGATNAALSLLLSGRDVRKAAPVIGERREEREL